MANTAGEAAGIPAPQAPVTTAAGDMAASTETYAAEGTIPARVPTAFNPVTDTSTDALSTFAMDVDTGSYTLARGSLDAGVIPDPQTVRTEEFVNAFEQDYDQPADGPFAVTIDGASAPFLPAGSRVVRVGIQGLAVDDADRKDANLTFVIDISGSMADPGKLDAIRPALHELVESLRPTDQVGIVVYSDSTRALLPPTSVSDRSAIDVAIQSLQPEGSTSVEAGLRLGYEEAQRTLDRERINRVVLLSDGVANVGATGPEEILSVIDDGVQHGIDLVTVGFGMGEYNDTLMEQLADQGDGFYAYVDGEREAVRLFSQDLTGTLQTIARDAKVQVEFNPATVRSYRLVGFENRAVADADFRNDAVDGGEVGAGHTVTALYEVSMQEGAGGGDGDWLARATIRWQHPETRAPSELAAELGIADVHTIISDASLRLQQDVYVAAFAESLAGKGVAVGGWDGLMSLEALSVNLHSLAERTGDAKVAEVANMVDARMALGGSASD
ncbi:MAG: von Willebrand factor type A domain-containing protein [Ilumatobacteraceae bacterium]